MRRPIKNRYEFAFLYDCKNGNPNGDPDNANAPRIDPQDNHGLVSDVCIKRKVRNFVLLAKNGRPPNDIFVRQHAELNSTIAKANKEVASNPAYGKFEPKKRATRCQADLAKSWMCQNFYDVRT